MDFVTIETDRLIIRDYKETDLDDMHRLWSDKEVMYFLNDIATNTVSETAVYLQTGLANADGHYFVFCDKATGQYLGCAGYTISETSPLGKVVHLGYMMLPEHQGRGYMTEVVKEVIKFAFTKDNCVRITTGCYKDNEASRRVMEKTDFRKEGEKIKAQYHFGVMKDRLDYAINKDEYEHRGR